MNKEDVQNATPPGTKVLIGKLRNHEASRERH